MLHSNWGEKWNKSKIKTNNAFGVKTSSAFFGLPHKFLCSFPAMAVLALQLVGLALSVLGCLGPILACALPMWKMTAFISSNIIVAQVFWEGLWMNCVYESTGQTQCKIYNSLLDLPSDLQAARALVVVSITIAVLSLLIAITGVECTCCMED